jgi:hypothetical protein
MVPDPMLRKKISWLLVVALTTMIHWSSVPSASSEEMGRQMSQNELVQRGKELRNEIDSVYQTLKAEKKLSGRQPILVTLLGNIFRPELLLTTQKRSCDPQVLRFLLGRRAIRQRTAQTATVLVGS